MADFIPAPLMSLVELIFVTNGQRTENTLWVKHDAVPNATLLENIAGAVATWWTTNLASQISQDCALVQVVATYKGDQSGPQAIVTAGLPDAGNVPTASTGNGIAFVVKFGTANIGRSYRGRNYIAGLPASAIVASAVTTSVSNAILGGYSSLGAVLLPLNAVHVVASFYTAGNPRLAAVGTEVTSYTATTLATRSQRRRNPGIGT